MQQMQQMQQPQMMAPRPNIPPPMPMNPPQQPPQGSMQQQIPMQTPLNQQIFIPQHQVSNPDPYLQPFQNLPEAVPIEKPEEIFEPPEHVVETTSETFSFVGRGKEIVEHDVLEETVVEAPNMEESTVDLSSASVVEVKQESVYEEKEEIIVHGADEQEKDIWKPPVSEEEEK
jgi:hypothetical protein